VSRRIGRPSWVSEVRGAEEEGKVVEHVILDSCSSRIKRELTGEGGARELSREGSVVNKVPITISDLQRGKSR